MEPASTGTQTMDGIKISRRERSVSREVIAAPVASSTRVIEAGLPPRAALALSRVRSTGLFYQQSAAGRLLYDQGKRLMDVAGALGMLGMVAPLLAVIAALIRLESPGPTLFKHRRLGKDGRLFSCMKFRTMYVDAEERLNRDPELKRRFELDFKLDKDPRITPLGDILRRTSLDELPQIYNVLIGEMSLIGPRPIVPAELEKYGEYGEKLLTVNPGLGGLWQASGRSDTTYDERVALDMAYIDHRSLTLDLWLLWETAVAALVQRGSR
jgi:lipopolysaccharide/colanic/teichoic acid biosynthesis glycosyltransferase